MSHKSSFIASHPHSLSLDVLVSAAKDKDLVHHYDVDMYIDKEAVKCYHILADFYRHPAPSLMAKEICLKLKEFSLAKEVEFKIRAINSWGKVSCEKQVSFHQDKMSAN